MNNHGDRKVPLRIGLLWDPFQTAFTPWLVNGGVIRSRSLSPTENRPTRDEKPNRRHPGGVDRDPVWVLQIHLK